MALGVGLFVASFVAAFVLSNYFYGGRAQAGPSAAAVADAPIAEQGRESSEPVVPPEQAIEESPPIPVTSAPVTTSAATEEDKAIRLQKAFKTGRLSREAYEANLLKLGLAVSIDRPAELPSIEVVPAPESTPEVPPSEDSLHKLGIEPEPQEVTTMIPATDPAKDKAAKLRAAYEAGKIPRELYERNLHDLGLLGLEPEPTRPPVAAPLSPEYRLERLASAYRAGRMSREMYERNVRALGGEPMPVLGALAPEPPPPDDRAERAAHVTKAFEAAFEESRIPREVNDRELAAIEGGHAAPPPLDLRVAKVREAYEAGRISRETYETNLRALGAREAVNPPPPPSAEEAVAPRASVPEAPVANPMAPGPARLPSEFEERVERLKRLFVEGKLSKEIYEKNLARTYEAVEPRLAQLRVAHEEGRISKDVYDANVRRVLQARGAP